MTKIFAICFILNVLWAVSGYALEIQRVDRQFLDPNLFTYKNYLIGDSKVNIFDMEEEVEKETLGERFIVRLKGSRYETGNRFKLVFSYKTDKMDHLTKIEREFHLETKREKLKFEFPTKFVAEKGRIELWKVEIFNSDKLIASTRSQGYIREFDFSSGKS